MLSMTRSRAALSFMSYLLPGARVSGARTHSAGKPLVLEDHGRERGARRRSRGRDNVAVAGPEQAALGGGLIVDEGVRAETVTDRRDVVEQHFLHQVVQQPTDAPPRDL